MSWVNVVLRKIGMSPFTTDEVMNAEAEDALHDQKKAVERVKQEYQLTADRNKNLRDVLRDARLRVSTFAQFEQRIRDMNKLHRRMDH